MIANTRMLVAFLVLVLVAGCADPGPPVPETETPATKLLIGLVPEHNVFRQIERYEPLTDYLSTATGMEITLDILPRYGDTVDRLVSAGVDGAFLGSFAYALAHSRSNMTVVARPVDLEGASTYHGLVFVSESSGISNVEQMRGKRFVFVDQATTAGYLLPLDLFSRHGILEPTAFLGEAYFAGTHEGAIQDVVEGRADIGAAKSTVFERLAEEDERIAKKLVILERSPEVPENALALRRDLDASVKDRLKQALLAMHLDPKGQEALRSLGEQRFIETTEDDYAPVFRYADEIGIDLQTYRYDE